MQLNSVVGVDWPLRLGMDRTTLPLHISLAGITRLRKNSQPVAEPQPVALNHSRICARFVPVLCKQMQIALTFVLFSANMQGRFSQELPPIPRWGRLQYSRLLRGILLAFVSQT